MNTMIRRAFILLVIALPVFLASCQSPAEPQVGQNLEKSNVTLSKEPVNVDVGTLKPVEMRQFATDMIQRIFIGSVPYYTAASANIASSKRTLNKVNVAGGFDYKYDLQYHTYHGVFIDTDPNAPRNLDILLQLRYMKTALGPILLTPAGADLMKTLITYKLKYGFPVSDPGHGTDATITFDGVWTGLTKSAVSLRADAKYYEIWKGYYNNLNARIVFAAEATIPNWTFYNNGNMTGTINIRVSPYFIKVTCNNSTTAKVELSSRLQPLYTFDVNIPDLLQWVSSFQVL